MVEYSMPRNLPLGSNVNQQEDNNITMPDTGHKYMYH